MFKNAKLTLILTAGLLPSALVAQQQGTIRFDRVVQYQFDLPNMPERFREMLPEQGVTPMLLHFTETESLMVPAEDPGEEPEEAAPMRGRDGFNPQMMARRLRASSANRSDNEEIVQVHVDTPTGAMVESRAFMGRDFIIEDERPSLAWRMTSEQAQHLGYMVIKAVTEHDGAEVEAWFTPQIPVQGGPAQYGGLPGMILVLSVNDGQMMYSATSVDLEGLDPSVIVRPDEGDEMSRVEYEEMVAEKLEERRMMNTRRRRRIGG